MLEARMLTKYYNHTPAVRQVSFTVRPGEILGYLGPNGAGKSTTVKMLTGLIEPSEGQIFYRGRSVYEDFTAFQRRLGYVPEEAHLYPHLTGREYLQLMGRLRGVPRRILDPKMDEFLRAFALWDDRHAPLSAYSKGMRQKILLSAALAARSGNPDPRRALLRPGRHLRAHAAHSVARACRIAAKSSCTVPMCSRWSRKSVPPS